MFQLIQAPMLECPVCGQPLPDDEKKKEMGLFGVERACWKCKQPIPKEKRRTARHYNPCVTCKHRKGPVVEGTRCKSKKRCVWRGTENPSRWEPKE